MSRFVFQSVPLEIDLAPRHSTTVKFQRKMISFFASLVVAGLVFVSVLVGVFLLGKTWIQGFVFAGLWLGANLFGFFCVSWLGEKYLVSELISYEVEASGIRELLQQAGKPFPDFIRFFESPFPEIYRSRPCFGSGSIWISINLFSAIPEVQAMALIREVRRQHGHLSLPIQTTAAYLVSRLLGVLRVYRGGKLCIDSVAKGYFFLLVLWPCRILRRIAIGPEPMSSAVQQPTVGLERLTLRTWMKERSGLPANPSIESFSFFLIEASLI